MTDKGRAAFNARHLRHGGGHAKGESGTTGDRLRLLEEMMRELEEEWAEHHAKKNPNIVLEDTHLNKSYMFDATTEGWKTPKSVDEVVAYGDDRAAWVGRKITARSYETTTLVVHLPRTLCKEVPDYYPVCDDDGNPQHGVDGQPLMRSRWVASDREKANRYLMEATEWLADNVLPGGREAVHGFNLQHDESTPHVQIMADTFAEHPNKPGVLRVEASQAWGSHRDVRYPEGHPQAGQQMGGNQKMRMYQQGLREHMHGLGYEVELDVSERADESLNKDRYAAEDDARRVLAADREKYIADAQLLGRAQKNFKTDVAAFRADVDALKSRQQEVIGIATELDGLRQELDDRESVLAGREEVVKSEEAALPEMKRKARAEGYEVGKSDGLAAAQEASEVFRARAVAEAQQVVQQAGEIARRLGREAETEAEEKLRQADSDAAVARAEAERKVTEATRAVSDAHEEAKSIKATAYAEAVKQGLQQGYDAFNRTVPELLTRDGGEKRFTVELISTLAGGDQTRIDQARTVVISKFLREAERTLAIGTPMPPTAQRIEAEARRAATDLVTDPEQARRIVTTGPLPGRRSGQGVTKSKGVRTELGG